MINNFKLHLNNLLPKKLLTELAGWFANLNAGFLTKIVIDIFVWFYKIDMSESECSNTIEYKTFNDFFVRALKHNTRPINYNKNIIVMPVDGMISQAGDVKNNQILQAKGHYYTLEALLAGDEQLISIFHKSIFITTYLSPNNYHRVHMPYNGIIKKIIYVPGSLYSVNNFMTNKISNLFARNERVICYFDTDFGSFIQILIGAIIVGSIETIWTGTVMPPREGIIKKWNFNDSYENNKIILKGQEMGRFKIGSTVINLFCFKKIRLCEEIKVGKKMLLGESIALLSK